jgi:hypothetical protein
MLSECNSTMRCLTSASSAAAHSEHRARGVDAGALVASLFHLLLMIKLGDGGALGHLGPLRHTWGCCSGCVHQYKHI